MYFRRQYVEFFFTFGQVFGTDQLYKRREAVHQRLLVLRAETYAVFVGFQRVSVAVSERAVCAPDRERKALSAMSGGSPETRAVSEDPNVNRVTSSSRNERVAGTMR